MSDKKIPLAYFRVSDSNRLYRLLWSVVNLLLFRFTPVFSHNWRVSLLNIFGAKLTKPCYVYPDVKIWSPKNLKMSSVSTLGPNVNCYNCALIEIGVNSTIS
jgi:putative colanic acid biosynthesis acetyltransferase WcaF